MRLVPQFQTKYFGAITYQPESILVFPEGLPGFEQERQFLLIEQLATRPIVFLHSLARPDLCFITLPLLVVEPNYRLWLAPEELAALGLPEDRQPAIGGSVTCLAIVSVREGRAPTANLLAPVVVSLSTRRAIQSVQTESDYSHQFPISLAAAEQPCS